MGYFPLVLFSLFLLTGFGFALRVDLEAPASYVVAVSSVQSSTSPIFTNNNNAHLVRPALHVQLVASNDFTVAFSSLKSSSSTFFPNALVVKIGCNKAKFEVTAYNNSQRRSDVIKVKLIKSTSLNQCNEGITVVVRHIVSCDNKMNKKMKKKEHVVFNWSQWLLIFSLLFLPGLLKYSILYFIRLRPSFHDYFDIGGDDAANE